MNGNKRILVVEDDQFLREFYQELLTREGFEVELAENGEVALKMMQTGGYDLVLLDIMMPKKDGLQVLKECKMSKSLIPNKAIVMLTNLANDKVMEQCFQMGANGYLTKSTLDPEKVITEIRNHLKANSD